MCQQISLATWAATLTSGIHQDSFESRAIAAMRWRQPPALIAGLSALHVWGIVEPPARVHLVTTRDSGMRLPPWLKVTRVTYSCPIALWNGHEIALPSWAIAQGYGLAPPGDRSEVVYRALRQGVATVAGVHDAISHMPYVPAKSRLIMTLNAAELGAESYLEERSLCSIFNLKEFSCLVRQHTVRLGGQGIRLDLFDPATRTAIEHDGAAFHGNLAQRERDLRRDMVLRPGLGPWGANREREGGVEPGTVR